MNEAVQKYVEAAAGVTQLTRKRAESVVKQLVKQGEAAADQAGELVDDLVERSRSNREAVSNLVRSETQRAIKAMGLASQEQVDRLQKEVTDLKKQVTETKKQAQKAAGTKSTGKKSTAKKSAAKKSTAKKSTSKQSSSTSSSTKKSSGGQSSS